MIILDPTDAIVDEIMEELSLRERSIIASTTEEEAKVLVLAFDNLIQQKAPGCDTDDGIKIIRRIRKRLSGSHRVRYVR